MDDVDQVKYGLTPENEKTAANKIIILDVNKISNFTFSKGLKHLTSYVAFGVEFNKYVSLSA